MGQCCAREGQDEQVHTIIPQPRDRQFTTIRMPMSPSHALREKQERDTFAQQSHVAGNQPYSSNMNKHRSAYTRGISSQPPYVLDPIIPGGEPTFHRPSDSTSKPSTQPPDNHPDSNNGSPAAHQFGPHSLTRTHPRTPASSLQSSGAGQGDARILDGRAAGRRRLSGGEVNGDGENMKPRPSFVPPLPLKEKGIEGQYGPG